MYCSRQRLFRLFKKEKDNQQDEKSEARSEKHEEGMEIFFGDEYSANPGSSNRSSKPCAYYVGERLDEVPLSHQEMRQDGYLLENDECLSKRQRTSSINDTVGEKVSSLFVNETMEDPQASSILEPYYISPIQAQNQNLDHNQGRRSQFISNEHSLKLQHQSKVEQRISHEESILAHAHSREKRKRILTRSIFVACFLLVAALGIFFGLKATNKDTISFRAFFEDVGPKSELEKGIDCVDDNIPTFTPTGNLIPSRSSVYIYDNETIESADYNSRDDGEAMANNDSEQRRLSGRKETYNRRRSIIQMLRHEPTTSDSKSRVLKCSEIAAKKNSNSFRDSALSKSTKKSSKGAYSTKREGKNSSTSKGYKKSYEKLSRKSQKVKKTGLKTKSKKQKLDCDVYEGKKKSKNLLKSKRSSKDIYSNASRKKNGSDKGEKWKKQSLTKQTKKTRDKIKSKGGYSERTEKNSYSRKHQKKGSTSSRKTGNRGKKKCGNNKPAPSPPSHTPHEPTPRSSKPTPLPTPKPIFDTDPDPTPDLPTSVPTPSPLPRRTPPPTPDSGPDVPPPAPPSSSPTQNPTQAPTPSPTLAPTPSPIPDRTPPPTPETGPDGPPPAPPSSSPTPNPTQTPTQAPTSAPTPSPIPARTPPPTPETGPDGPPPAPPSSSPTPNPTQTPTQAPTLAPTPSPVPARTPPPTPDTGPDGPPPPPPSSSPTQNPTQSPTPSPTPSPSKQPTSLPTKSPSKSPSKQPTLSPTIGPSRSPSKQPTPSPTTGPSRNPSKQPTSSPTKSPSKQPTPSPTTSPSRNPSKQPTPSPSKSPSKQPTSSPTFSPSRSPSKQPTPSPTTSPTKNPTPQQPDGPVPTSFPTKSPTTHPSPAPVAIGGAERICTADCGSGPGTDSCLLFPTTVTFTTISDTSIRPNHFIEISVVNDVVGSLGDLRGVFFDCSSGGLDADDIQIQVVEMRDQDGALITNTTSNFDCDTDGSFSGLSGDVTMSGSCNGSFTCAVETGASGRATDDVAGAKIHVFLNGEDFTTDNCSSLGDLGLRHTSVGTDGSREDSTKSKCDLVCSGP